MTGQVAVVGSANIDLVVPVDHHPVPGETVLGGTLRRSPGGKGANQAVAAARAGQADTSFVAALGRDEHADILLRSLDDAGVRTDVVRRTDSPTGTALITVSADGENAIVVAPGANADLGAPEGEARDRVAQADVVLAQLEIPLDAVLGAARARRSGALLVLNAAPPAELTAEVWDAVDVLVVNEHEARALAGSEHDDARAAADDLTARVGTVVLTLGAAGCVVLQHDADPVTVAAPTVSAVDTTGAGDTFCGVLAAALAQGAGTVPAARRAVAAGALAVTRHGAQEAVPDAAAVTRLVREQWGDGSDEPGGTDGANRTNDAAER
ncbi:ribokinase [Georgenia sp. 10Sc9-8]|uniref:Ribokinase n=1 Tax=Georgenia halotolerans TaxID=3028317 RepID=A0ABT5U3D9_9MICO|nr:ribokinase [Georgenia halotolerans]